MGAGRVKACRRGYWRESGAVGRKKDGNGRKAARDLSRLARRPFGPRVEARGPQAVIPFLEPNERLGLSATYVFYGSDEDEMIPAVDDTVEGANEADDYLCE